MSNIQPLPLKVSKLGERRRYTKRLFYSNSMVKAAIETWPVCYESFWKVSFPKLMDVIGKRSRKKSYRFPERASFKQREIEK